MEFTASTTDHDARFAAARRKLLAAALPAAAGVLAVPAAARAMAAADTSAGTGAALSANTPLLFNVRDYGATGNGTSDDTAAIQAAIDTAAIRGGIVYLPAAAGGYRTTNTLVITRGGVALRGDGPGSVILAAHGGDTVAIIGGGIGAEIYYNEVSNLHFASARKTGGNEIAAAYVAKLVLENLLMTDSHCGFWIRDFNTIRLRNIMALGCSGLWCGLLSGGASGKGRSDVAYLENITLHCKPRQGSETIERFGLIVDGFVHTVAAQNLFLLSLEGKGLWVRNSIGAADVPGFLNFYGLQSEFCRDECVRIDAAVRVMFTDVQLHGSRQADNLFLGPGVQSATICGGHATGAAGSGLVCAGQNIQVNGLTTQWNGYAGIVVAAASRGTVVCGTRAGTFAANEPRQAYGILIETNAEHFVVSGNCTAGNTYGVRNLSGNSATRVVSANSGA